MWQIGEDEEEEVGNPSHPLGVGDEGHKVPPVAHHEEAQRLVEIVEGGVQHPQAHSRSSVTPVHASLPASRAVSPDDPFGD